ncbi:DNA-processing protein DprA [uncultured Jatrophihabitans sp.]|uniref:DNA-processing protein DprA n=1 Tax=uncultured Jatrophihabitans sp. TaxID=1610747 RepID=UPI0035CBFB9E
MGGMSVREATGAASDEPVRTPVADDVLLARAYLSRVAEPSCIPLWGLVHKHGPVVAVEKIRAGDLPDGLASFVAARRASADPHADLAAAERGGIRLVVPESPDWPHFAMAALEYTGLARLAEYEAGNRVHDRQGELMPPLALWVRGPGDLTTLAVRSVGLVGARTCTPYGAQVAGELAYGLASRSFPVVSGGAYGIDAAAHRGALAAGGETILVSAGGLDRAYPAAHQALFRSAAESGLLVSESPPGCAPHRARFLTRNRLISAFGTGTVIVESARRSGARNTAGHCVGLGRPLMVVPGPVTSAMSVGNHDLLKSGPAVLVTSVADIVDVIGSIGEQGPDDARDEPSPQTPVDERAERAAALRDLLDSLDDGSRQVYDGLPSRRPITVSDLVQTSGLPATEVLAALPLLMLHGLAEHTEEGVRRRRPGARR